MLQALQWPLETALPWGQGRTGAPGAALAAQQQEADPCCGSLPALLGLLLPWEQSVPHGNSFRAKPEAHLGAAAAMGQPDLPCCSHQPGRRGAMGHRAGLCLPSPWLGTAALDPEVPGMP